MFQRSIEPEFHEVSHKLVESPTGNVYFNHIHNHCEILLFIRGSARYNIDGQIFKPAPYDILFIPGATYHYLIPETAVPYENYVIGLDPSLIQPEHYAKLFSPPTMFNIKDDPQLLSFFSRLDYYDQAFDSEDFNRCAASLACELITYCAYQKDHLNTVKTSSLTQVDRIIRYIADHLEQPLDAKQIAKHFSLSESYVQNLFSQSMHIGLKKYINQKKIYAAHTDLMHGASPKAVCEKYGFADYSTFYRHYKKCFASSPRLVR